MKYLRKLSVDLFHITEYRRWWYPELEVLVAGGEAQLVVHGEVEVDHDGHHERVDQHRHRELRAGRVNLRGELFNFDIKIHLHIPPVIEGFADKMTNVQILSGDNLFEKLLTI